jgi:hypothetical protein
MSGEPRPPPPSFETLAARARVDVDTAFTTKTWCSAASKLIDQVRRRQTWLNTDNAATDALFWLLGAVFSARGLRATRHWRAGTRRTRSSSTSRSRGELDLVYYTFWHLKANLFRVWGLLALCLTLFQS